MSIEEEPSTLNKNVKSEVEDNQIEGKVNIKQIKSSILSPPDTPQINTIKKVENETKIENKNDESIDEEKENSNENINLVKEDLKIVDNKINSENEKNALIKNVNSINYDDKNEINENSRIIISNSQNQNVKSNENSINNGDNIKNNEIVKKQNENTVIENNNKLSDVISENEKISSEKENPLISTDNYLKETKIKIDKVDEINKQNTKIDVINKENKKEHEKSHKMTRSNINICINITHSLQYHSSAIPFLNPVDPELLNIPDYFTVIKHPMDLSTIMKKVKGNKYSDINDYISDVELMFNNCFTYNPPTNPVHIAGLALREYFIEQLRKLSPEVQALLKILTREDNGEYLYANGKRAKRQIKAVHHLEPELHIPKKMKVVHKSNIESIKEDKISIENKKIEIENIPNDNKIIFTKQNSFEKANTIKPIKIQEEQINRKNNENKTTIKKLISNSRAKRIVDLVQDKYNKNEQILREDDDEEDEIEEEQETEDDSEMIENEETTEEEEVDDSNNLSRKTKSIIRASQKVISRMKSKNTHTKIRNVSAHANNINKRPTKSKLLKSISKVQTLSSLPVDQVYQGNSSDIVEMQINTLTMCLQKVTKQLELLQVQSKARKLKKKAKRLAKSLNMEDYDLQSDSDSVENLLSQTSLLTNNANKILKRKSKVKMLSKKAKVNKIKNQNRRINNENDEDEEEYDEGEEIYEDENSRIVDKKKEKNVINEKQIKKEVKRQRQKNTKQETKGKKRVPKGSQENSYDIKRVCEYCGDTDTPMWRRGPNGKGTLCNKCGVKWKGGKIYQGEEIPMKRNKNITNESVDSPVIPPPPKKERKRAKTKDKKKETTKVNKSKQQKVTEITYNQKKELSEMINYLSEEKISGVVDIIKSSIPDIKDTQEEIELDIETINPATLYKLYNYVKKVSKPKNGKKNQNKNEDTSSGESSGESSESEDESSDSDSDSNQYMTGR
ncbi:hypothetical protein U3516DRAFT_585878 [Neocallimastix sp. 'constans']|jgi:hypothetical protein